MPAIKDFSHLKIDKFFNRHNYIYPADVIVPFKIKNRNRAAHARNLSQQLTKIKDQFNLSEAQVLPKNIVKDNVVYVEFISEWDFSLKFESLHQDSEDPKFQILSIKKEQSTVDKKVVDRFRVLVMITEGGVSAFLKKVNEYLKKNGRYRGEDTGKPKNEALLNNIHAIEIATLRSFWSDDLNIEFPDSGIVVWWEAWFRKTSNDEINLQRVLNNLQEVKAEVSKEYLTFPEHYVYLIKATAIQLSSSLVLLDSLAELRKPQQLNDFITDDSIDYNDKKEWLDDLLARTEIISDGSPLVICLLDSGVNRAHPLIEKFLSPAKMFTYKSAWGTTDSWPDGGHGTAMAGIAIYGDMVEVLSSKDKIKIYYSLESFKIIQPNDPTNPTLYGVVTETACATPIIENPAHKRIYCLAITDGTVPSKGRPSSWSAAIDKIAFGNNFETQTPQLIIISGGNVDYISASYSPADYPNINLLEAIHDPSQCYNGLTIGSFTKMDGIDPVVWPSTQPLAPVGGMSPSNSTSVSWNSQWPNKPDLVFEGGNLAVQGSILRDDVHTLKPLSLDKDFRSYIFLPFGDTSCAAAFASKMAAEITLKYPDLWPETIRGLMVHSAEWTPTMLRGIDLTRATVLQKREILRTFGYGTPNLQKALENVKSAVTLIAENMIQPYRVEKGGVKSNEYHLYEIPWPVDILRDSLAEHDVTLTVTLSYFVEPNPGNRYYSNNFQYHSHSLDFKVIKPTEDPNTFKRRVSKNDDPYSPDYEGSDEPWTLKEAIRNKGSIKKDFIISSGADLATRKYIAVYPKNGWYRTRKKLERGNSPVRYSLIVSIESKKLDIDIYTPVFNLINVKVHV